MQFTPQTVYNFEAIFPFQPWLPQCNVFLRPVHRDFISSCDIILAFPLLCYPLFC